MVDAGLDCAVQQAVLWCISYRIEKAEAVAIFNLAACWYAATNMLRLPAFLPKTLNRLTNAP